jgi:DNA uptake protein ComE-like DNA-binding protein
MYHLSDFQNDSFGQAMSDDVESFRKQIDSLKQVALVRAKPKVNPFNPNFISDYKGYQLGLSVQEIDRLHQFRKKGKFVNSAKEFQDITKVSDSLLSSMSSYFKFPDWVQKQQQKKFKQKMTFHHEIQRDETLVSTTDLNQATLTDFLAIDGVTESISERIIKYRTKLQGFVFADQIMEVWGLDEVIAKKIMKVFSIQTIPDISKININTANFKEVLKTPYIDYDLCVKIFDYRDEVAELQDISELKNIEGFPIDKYDRIVVYLLAK